MTQIYGTCWNAQTTDAVAELAKSAAKMVTTTRLEIDERGKRVKSQEKTKNSEYGER